MFTARALFTLVLGLLGARMALGQVTLDTTVVLPDVTVTATRMATSVARAPVRVSVLDADAVEATAATSVADLLETRTSLFIKRLGEGGLASVSFRGTGASQTLVLLDGHRIVDPQLGQLDYSLLPSLLVQSAEVVHGPGSPLYGADAMGGVINLRTFTPGATPQVRAIGGLGAYGERMGSLVVSGVQDRLSGLVLAEYQGAAGDFPYFDPLREEEVRRMGADRQQRSFFASGGYGVRRHEIQVSGWYTDAERGLPGAAGSSPQGERQWDETLRLWADDRVQVRWGTLHVGGLVQRNAIRYVNPSLQGGIDDTGRTLTASLTADATAALDARWTLAGGVSGGYGAASHPSLQEAASEFETGAFLSATGRYGRLLIFPALRADAYFPQSVTRRIALSPRLGLNVQPFATRPLFLKGSVGRSFRMPTFNQRYWMPGGNPNLLPENGWTADLGAYLQQRRSHAELTVFTGRTWDEIVWLLSPQGYWAPRNLSRVLRRGLEAGYHWERPPDEKRLYAGLTYSHVQALDQSDPASPAYNQQLRYVPREQLKAHLGTELGPFLLDLNGRYVGRRYPATGGSFFLDPFFVLDGQVRVGHRFGGFDAQLSLAVDNLLDAQYAIVENYPMPPRHATLRLLIQTSTKN